MDKVNFKKELAHLYNPKNIEWQLVRVPTMNFVMVDGRGILISPRTTVTQSRRFIALPTP
jgi:hypothetical protein